LLTVIFILELAAGITGYILKNSTKELVMNALRPTMIHYADPDNKHITKGWDEIHTNFRCCGLESYEDWKQAQNGSVPLSCCEIPNGVLDEFKCNNETTTLYPDGCVNTFGSFIQTHAASLAIAGLVLAFIQLIGLLFACIIARRIKKNRVY
jgi:CD63 antigen